LSGEVKILTNHLLIRRKHMETEGIWH